MVILKNEKIVPIDVDDTLIMHGHNKEPGEGKIKIIDPYDGEELYFKPHKFHIKLLKASKARGYVVIVWSQNGYKWATAVVGALGLENHINFVMTKPEKYMDDLDSSNWMGQRLYFPERVDG